MSVVSGRPGQGPGGARPPAAAPQASLRRLAAHPMMGRRETGAGGRAGVFGCAFCSVPWSGSRRAAVPLAAFIPSRARGRGRGRMGRVRVRGGQAGSIKTTPAPPVAAGQKNGRPRAWPLARKVVCCSCRAGRRHVFGGPGQAAELAVAQAVVDQGEQLAGGGDLRDVPGLVASPGDDGLLGGAGHRVSGCPLDGLDHCPAQLPRSLLGDVPAGDLDVGYLKPQPGCL